MNTAQREQLKDNLRAMISGANQGIDVNTVFHWVIEGIKQPGPFFTGLTALIPPDSVLYFEGGHIAPVQVSLPSDTSVRRIFTVGCNRRNFEPYGLELWSVTSPFQPPCVWGAHY
jgi:hypothetical protein